MKVSKILGSQLVNVIRTRQIIDRNFTKPVKKWASKQKDLTKKMSRQRKLLGR